MFTQMLGAALAAPLMPVPVMAASPAAVATPKIGIAAKFWADYFKTSGGKAALGAAQAQGATLTHAKTLVMRTMATGGYSPAAAAVQMAMPKAVKMAKMPMKRALNDLKFDDVPENLRNLTQDITCDCEVEADNE